MAGDQLLEIVNEADEVIGTAMRSEIHAQGLLHREVSIWFVLPDKRIVFQRRGPNKDVFPNLLSAGVGGHVEPNQTYETAALQEAFEETGLRLSAEDLLPLVRLQVKQGDPERGTINNVFRFNYAYRFDGDLADLKIEAEAGAGFEALSLEDIPSRKDLVPGFQDPIYDAVWRAIERL